MKVTKEDGEFRSFQITLDVETAEEARALYAIFNHSDNARLITPEMADEIRDTIGIEYGNLNAKDIIAHGVSYSTFYEG